MKKCPSGRGAGVEPKCAELNVGGYALVGECLRVLNGYRVNWGCKIAREAAGGVWYTMGEKDNQLSDRRKGIHGLWGKQSRSQTRVEGDRGSLRTYQRNVSVCYRRGDWAVSVVTRRLNTMRKAAISNKPWYGSRKKKTNLTPRSREERCCEQIKKQRKP